eukprot:CAMPEP_0194482098 /NCGR_PEP_ID=MMETSP0253-20130528/4207_1 /TAXON_ID=2966 /ORGANISM="Noctiluca scintillans" /LENGTH=280 /DNA_ID=CAMNT_0039321615 /DNA_START=428 /DNA_END=1270 /DNA_ORIENTATION=-
MWGPLHLRHALTVLLTLVPLSLVDAAVPPCEDAVPMLQVVLILPVIGPSIAPCVETLAVHAVRPPFTSVLPAIGPGINAVSVDEVLNELTVIARTICPRETTLPVPLVTLIASRVSGTIGPLLLALSILFVVFPLACVASTTSSDSPCAVTVGPTLPPLALVDVAAGAHVSPRTMCLVVQPLTLVVRATGPHLDTFSAPLLSVPFAGVHGAIVELVCHLLSAIHIADTLPPCWAHRRLGPIQIGKQRTPDWQRLNEHGIFFIGVIATSVGAHVSGTETLS